MTGIVTGIPFDEWLRASQLRHAISPRDFWRLSLREWLVLTRPDLAPLTRSKLENLLTRWPDNTDEK